ncbi:hypothetical protein RhoFasGS6_00555 [Rhodococcus fascians]|nr:hypothetical protein [Rhodococcus fascians]
MRLDQKAREDEVVRQRFEREQASMNETRAQIAQYEALKAGPDRLAGTDDDNAVTYDFDTNQYVIDNGTPNAGSGGSSGGGGGGLCRHSQWC